MARGKLRVLLGAAPGVGKTVAMLDDAHALIAEGKNVVVGVVETHGRTGTAARAEGLPRVPLRAVEHRGVSLNEFDLDATIAAHPHTVLIDELAHTNAPGSRNEKRWQDVFEVLDAGINVITTINVQHIESLGDVIEQVTGQRQRETVPDRIVRSADDIELVDLQPASLRDRLAGGLVYPAERIDAALSNYFRLGNLTALRELALLWLADEVDAALRTYRDEHGIDAAWHTRERVVVAITGGPEGETLLRRGARIAARSSGGELLAIHVTANDGLRVVDPAAVAAQRSLVERLGGTFHHVVSDDIATSIVEFARSAHASQIVVGVSRRGRLRSALTGGSVGQAIIQQAGDMDVHIVHHDAGAKGLALPRSRDPLSRRRRIAGWIIALGVGPILTWFLSSIRSEESITSDVLAFQLLVITVALVGGMWPAMFAAVLSGLTIDFFFVEPVGTVTVDEPIHLLALVLYVASAIMVSLIVSRAARTTRIATRSAAESQLLSSVAGSVLGGDSAIRSLVDRAREVLSLTGVRLMRGTSVIATSGEPAGDQHPAVFEVSGDTTLELHGRELDANDRRLLDVIVAQLRAGLAHAKLEQAARDLEPVAEQDRVRSALLRAVGHDLRAPLAAASAAVGALRSPSIDLDAHTRDELVATADDALARLSKLVTDLLDVSRIEAGALAVAATEIEVDDVVLRSLDELSLGPDTVELDLEDVPTAHADAVLLQRVLVNLLTNAVRHSPAGTPVRLATSAFGNRVQVRVIDRGPGLPNADMFVPFQRLGDTDTTTGLGLGLALSKGFVEGMQGSLEAEPTPGGGLTMIVSLPTEAA